MQTKTIKATFERGVFRPLDRLSLPEGTTVNIEIQVQGSNRPWMQCAGSISNEDAQDMIAAIEEACENVDPADWK